MIDAGQSPAEVADQLDVPLSAVYEALSYYYGPVDELRELERANEDAVDRVAESSLNPNERIG